MNAKTIFCVLWICATTAIAGADDVLGPLDVDQIQESEAPVPKAYVRQAPIPQSQVREAPVPESSRPEAPHPAEAHREASRGKRQFRERQAPEPTPFEPRYESTPFHPDFDSTPFPGEYHTTHPSRNHPYTRYPVHDDTAYNEPFTAPPIIVGPNGGSIPFQENPATAPSYPADPTQPYGDYSVMSPPVYEQPGVYPQSSWPTPQLAPATPYGESIFDPGLIEPAFPYSAQTPDVTLLPGPLNGPLPNRYGWTHRYDAGLLPKSQASDGQGHFGVTEFDFNWLYRQPLHPVPQNFSFTQQYGLRLWDGPATAPGSVDLPGSVHRIGWDFELRSTEPSPWNMVVAFNPSINSDFESSVSSDAWSWDGRGALLYSPSRELTYVFGAAYWDRVNDQVIPWAGVVYRPNDYWQWDLVFPQLRVSVYSWDEFGFRTSFYARAEYHVEAYEIHDEDADAREQVEIEDWRALIGVNKDRGLMAYYLEAGWVFGRNVDFKHSPQGFDVTSGFISHAGIRF